MTFHDIWLAWIDASQRACDAASFKFAWPGPLYSSWEAYNRLQWVLPFDRALNKEHR